MLKILSRFTFASAYLSTVLAVLGWTVYVDISLLGSAREHLLPGIALAAITLPLSSIAGPLSRTFPELFSSPLIYAGLSAVCGLCQAAFLFVIVFARRKASR